jgi:hypothetical protein
MMLRKVTLETTSGTEVCYSMLETIAKHFAWPDSDALMYFVQ